jgi:hypothetical protein
MGGGSMKRPTDQVAREHSMSHQPDSSQYVRRVVLPSGRAIEVVYFDNTLVPPAEEPAVEIHDGGFEQLHVCPSCERQLVYPVDWEEASATHWEVELRCPNCEWRHVGTYDQDTVDLFDEELDRGTEHLVRDLKRLTRANMEHEVERFVAALDADAIWPMDF